MKHQNKPRFTLFFLVFLLLIKSGYLRGQPVKSASQNTGIFHIDQEMERHKWEMNVNLSTLFKLGTTDWAYSYLVKRNLGEGKKTGALRFTVNPYLIRKNQTFYPNGISGNNLKSTYFVPYVVLGYERQKIRGRFAFFYGVDLGWRTELTKFRDKDAIKNNDDGTTVRGDLFTKSIQNSVWIAPLIGGKYYINHRFSLSIESHIRAIFGRRTLANTFDGVLVYKDVNKEIFTSAMGSYALNISYNF